MNLPSNPRVCIVLLSAVGDVVHALPVVNAIKRAHPKGKITWLLQDAGASLLQGHSAIDEILLFHRKAGLAAFIQTALQLRERTFDVVLDLQCYLKASLLTAFCQAPAKVGLDPARAREFNWVVNNHHLPKRPVNHVQEHFLEFLDYLQIPREPVEWNLGPWPSERPWQENFFRSITRPRVALVAGTSNPRKDWIPERWVELNDRLHREFGLATILVGAKTPRETALGQKMGAECRHPPVNALGSGLRRLVSLLDACDLVISPDTGPLHLAGALGKPVIGLYGYNSPARVGPWRQDPRLLVDAFHDSGETPQMTFTHRPGRMEKITVSEVLDRVKIWAAAQKR
ncbi:MAG: lipopolysaccharide heptosyltransferase family protein [Verrucomicrobia bacterium]|nr:lipopolysaccharide heptosyltransferase family protein [Verrucomicrobiota bacterium]NBR63251.1 lipopolysaccharide heptosyltransferase family protein [Verrucomicrobiota bacterium]NBU68532.1 lipopolysaccharide heptosyltransferase family protein [Verrucomicrobiota bacterium]